MKNKEKDMAELLNAFEDETAKEHDSAVANARGAAPTRVTAHLSMPKETKDWATKLARAHGMNLSSLFRLAVEEYAANHNW